MRTQSINALRLQDGDYNKYYSFVRLAQRILAGASLENWIFRGTLKTIMSLSASMRKRQPVGKQATISASQRSP